MNARHIILLTVIGLFGFSAVQRRISRRKRFAPE